MQVVECSIYLLSFEFDQKALDILQISKENQENGFAMLSAVLWLGNISFSVIDNENHVKVVADEGIYIFGHVSNPFLHPNTIFRRFCNSAFGTGFIGNLLIS